LLLLTEEDDISTRTVMETLDLPAHFSIITVPDGKPRTKPRACNYGLLQATGEYIVIYDAEDVPDPLQLKKAVLAFANQSRQTACIQAKLNFYNSNQNILTRWFTAEYSLWFDLTLPGLQKLGVPLPLGGTSNHFRTSALRKLGAWDAFNVTEDCDLGLRMAHYGFKTAILDSTTYEEANSQFRNWIRQRSRWIKGYMQTYLVYMRHPLIYLKRERLAEFFSLQLFVGAKTGVLLVNPFMWMLLLIYLLLRPVTLYHALFPAPILYMGVACLIFGNFFYTYSHIIGCMKRGQYALVKWTLLIFFYWAMASAAAFMALQQLILKPHYWEKTQHGLHLQKTGAKVAAASPDDAIAREVEHRTSMLVSASKEDLELVTTAVSSHFSGMTDAFDPDATVKMARVKLPVDLQAATLHPTSLELQAYTISLPGVIAGESLSPERVAEEDQ
jgi:cellulose synthase/poly-beta-1,6-N-acetylglucosamine synthase-like glycosyltransferase